MSKESAIWFHERQSEHCLKMADEWIEQSNKLKQEIARLGNDSD